MSNSFQQRSCELGYQYLSAKDEVFDFCKKVSLSNQYNSGFRRLPKELRETVNVVFPNEFALAYVLSDNLHRHAWNIYLLKYFQPNLLGFNEENVGEVRHHLISTSPKKLVCKAGFPSSVLSVLRGSNQLGYGPEFYWALGDVLNKTPKLVRQLVNVVFDEKVILLLSFLPEPYRDIRFAENFGDVDTFVGFMDVYQLVAGSSHISSEHLHDLKSGMQHHKLLRRLVYETKLHEGFLSDNDRIRHLGSWKAVDAAARAYNNCLRAMFDEFLSNAIQVYEIKLCDDELCIVALTNEGVLGWVFSEAKLFQNEALDDDQMQELLDYLSGFGVTRTKSVQRIIRGDYGCPF